MLNFDSRRVAGAPGRSWLPEEKGTMCGRYTLRTPKRILEESFGLPLTFDYRPRFNIAPSQQILVLIANAEGQRRWEYLKWGLVPYWAKDVTIAHKLINARSETVMQKPAFKDAFRHRRCLVIADGFYEWKPEGRGKQPYLFSSVSGQPLAFAGLWENWFEQGSEGGLLTGNILTKPADPVVSPVHHRMPVIVQPADYADWLNRTTPLTRLTQLLSPSVSPLLSVRVSRTVNSAANDLEICAQEEDPGPTNTSI